MAESMYDIIKHEREKAGMTQKELAHKLGVAVGTVCNWESGATQPRCDFLQGAAGLFGYEVVIQKKQTPKN